MTGLLTDLYQLTMAAGFFEAGKSAEKATFELFLRRLPPNRNFVVAAGLAQVVEYLQEIRFSEEELDYLRGLPQFTNVSPKFFEALRAFRFTGDVFAVPEGTPVFAGEPLLTVRAPLLEAQIPETFLLSTVGFQTSVATKAVRMVESAGGRSIIEFGTRRAQSPHAGVLAGRASYIGGSIGTSNTVCGFRYGVPVFGTSAHSWIQAFPGEGQAFEHLQKLLGSATVYLIDTYDTIEGARKAAALGRPLWGVRLDSGNLVELSREVRHVLDDAGLHDAKIMASGDLNEYKILELVAAGAPVDAFGVGTELATSADAPSLGAVYKLAEVEVEGVTRYTAKYSEDKQTWPGAKQVFRFPDHDVIGRASECIGCPPGSAPVEALLKPVMIRGQLTGQIPTAQQSRDYASRCMRKLPAALHTLFPTEQPWRVEYSEKLAALARRVRENQKVATP